MDSWIFYLIIFSQIIVLYWFAAPINSRLTYQVFLGRNPQYVAGNDAFLHQFPPPRYSIRIAYAIGTFWIGALAYVIFQGDSDRTLVFGLVAPLLSWTILCFGYIGVEYYRILKKIPLPAKRHASLDRRCLKDYMNPMWAYLAYFFIFLIAAIYVVGYLNGRIAVDLFIARMVGLTIVTVFGSLCLLYSLRRKSQPIDEELGPMYRKMEVVGIIPLLLLTAPIGGWRILQDFYGVQLFTDLTFFAVFSVLIQAFILYFVLHPGIKRLVSASH